MKVGRWLPPQRRTRATHSQWARRSTTHRSHRTCVACRRIGDTSQMVRISRAGNGGLQIGASGGRGAWICARDEAIDVAATTASLSRALRGKVEREEIERLNESLRERRATERRGA
ncbi:MAG: YlxR family protein [Candidatus Limnocylindrus sp.]